MTRTHVRMRVTPADTASIPGQQSPGAQCCLWEAQVVLNPKKQEVLRQHPGFSSDAWQAARRKEGFWESWAAARLHQASPPRL